MMRSSPIHQVANCMFLGMYSRVTVKATVKATGLNIWVSGEQSDSGPEVE